jgi:glycerate kinase
VCTCPGAGAAGGLAGGLAAVGGELVGGFDLVADEVGLAERLEGADLVVTGEGFLDEQSFDGKVVGGVLGLAGRLRLDTLVVCGRHLDDLTLDHRLGDLAVVSLVERFGEERALSATTTCITEAVAEALAAWPRRSVRRP